MTVADFVEVQLGELGHGGDQAQGIGRIVLHGDDIARVVVVQPLRLHRDTPDAGRHLPGRGQLQQGVETGIAVGREVQACPEGLDALVEQLAVHGQGRAVRDTGDSSQQQGLVGIARQVGGSMASDGREILGRGQDIPDVVEGRR